MPGYGAGGSLPTEGSLETTPETPLSHGCHFQIVVHVVSLSPIDSGWKTHVPDAHSFILLWG